MKNKTGLLSVIMILTSLILWSCEEDNEMNSAQAEFCMLIDNQGYDATGSLIDDYLAGLERNNSEVNLERLVDWLESISCVNNAEIICNSCLYSLPPQSRIQVGFNSNGRKITKILNISMSDPLDYRGYHEIEN